MTWPERFLIDKLAKLPSAFEAKDLESCLEENRRRRPRQGDGEQVILEVEERSWR
jgi:hypothetical protein